MQAINPISSYRAHFDSIYIAGVPCLLNDDGAFLSFITVLTATEALAGLFQPELDNGPRFKAFVAEYFPPPLHAEADTLWKFRNSMVHAFNPGPYALTHHASRNHLSTDHGPKVLNAEDFYAALVTSSQRYFADLTSRTDLQERFAKRLSDGKGGAPQIYKFESL